MGGGTKEFGWTIGCLLAGTSFNTYLFGVVSRQYISYLSSDFQDPLWIRTTVRLLLLVDIIHSTILFYVPWWYLVTNYNNPSATTEPVWALLVTPLFESISAALTQNFLAHRLFCLNRRRRLRRMLLVMIFGGFAFGSMGAAWPFFQDTKTWADVKRLRYMYILRHVLQSITDLIIAISLAWEFRGFRTGEARSDRLLTWLTRKTIQTGAFATLFSCCASFTLTVTWEYTGLLAAAFAVPLGRIYTNALMDSLIMRSDLRRAFMADERLTEVVARGLENAQSFDSSRNSTSSMQSSHSTRSAKDIINLII